MQFAVRRGGRKQQTPKFCESYVLPKAWFYPPFNADPENMCKDSEAPRLPGAVQRANTGLLFCHIQTPPDVRFVRHREMFYFIVCFLGNSPHSLRKRRDLFC